jgi:small conductance mechanosensitive channel
MVVNPDLGNELWKTCVLFLPKIATALLLFGVFWVIGFLLRNLIHTVGGSRRLDPELTRFLGNAAKTAVLLFGAVTALGTLGVDVGALVAGLGLTGFALGMAFKDIISNALSGILILVYEPFGHNDRIKVSSFEGTVKSIDLRYTVLEREDEQVFVPNSLLFTNALIVEKSESGE